MRGLKLYTIRPGTSLLIVEMCIRDRTYPEGGKIPESVKKYRLEQGADGMKEVE